MKHDWSLDTHFVKQMQAWEFLSDREQNYVCMSASDWKFVCSEIRLIDFLNSYFKNKNPSKQHRGITSY